MEPSDFSIFGCADVYQLIKSFLPIICVNALGGDISHYFRLITNPARLFSTTIILGLTWSENREVGDYPMNTSD